MVVLAVRKSGATTLADETSSNDNFCPDTAPSRAGDVGAVAYVGASDQLQSEERR